MVLSAGGDPHRTDPRGAEVPRTIHALWLQGLDAAPDLVRFNLQRWKDLHPDYRINILDQAAAEALLADTGLPLRQMRPQALANILRMRLLLDQGGVWVDASLVPIVPLGDWLPGVLTPVGFFAFSDPGPDRPLSNFFLVGSQDNPILRAWYDASLVFWNRPRTLRPGVPDDPPGTVSPGVAGTTDTYPYFWHHYLFRHLLNTRPDIAALWKGCATVSADPPRRLQRLLKANPQAALAEQRAAAVAAPVQKLNWRVTPAPTTLDAVVGRLPVPAIIHAMWLQGRDQAPPLVQMNLRRWEQLNPGYEVRVADRADALALLADTKCPLDRLTPQALSDLTRLRLLRDHGGIWVDASVTPARPLDDWLPEMIEPGGFFAFSDAGPDRPVSSWFVAARRGNPIVQTWYEAAMGFWSKERRFLPGRPDDPAGSVAPGKGGAGDEYPYFWLHYLFLHLIRTRPDFAGLWASCRHLPAEPQGRLQKILESPSEPDFAAIRAALAAAPVHKLDWRHDYPPSVLEALSGRSPLPRVIHALWLQGIDKAPPLARRNLKRWARLNPGWRLNLLDRAAAERVLAPTGLDLGGMAPQVIADLVRMRLLLDEGGVWTDVSVLPVKPLDEWLPAMMTDTGFFAFDKPGPDRPLSNWFLAATPGSPILEAWWQAALSYWDRPRTLVPGIPADPVASVAPGPARESGTYPYFVHHYLFAWLLATKPGFSALWARSGRLPAGPPHAIQDLYSVKRRPRWKTLVRAARATKMQKLDWRKSYPLPVLWLVR